MECAATIKTLIESKSKEDLLRLWATEDETWMLFDSFPCCKSENKAWLRKDEPRLRVVKPKLTNRKALLLVAFTGDKKISVETLKPKETVTSESYVTFIRRTGDKWRTLRSSPTKLSELFWQHDNARPHSASTTVDFGQAANQTISVQPGFKSM